MEIPKHATLLVGALAVAIAAVGFLAFTTSTVDDEPANDPDTNGLAPPEIDDSCIGLTSEGTADGDVILRWTNTEIEDQESVIYRILRDGTPVDALFLGNLQPGDPVTWIDTNVTEGSTHTYTVRVFEGDSVQPECSERVEVTAIPFFPGLAAMLGTAGAAGAYTALRRR